MKKPFNLLIVLFLIGLTFVFGMVAQKYYDIQAITQRILPEFNPWQKELVLKQKHQGKLSIFILAGQSNMEGYGQEEIVPLNDGKIYVFKEGFTWLKAKEPIRTYIGPSMAIAREISNQTDHPIGILNVAVGGTNIEQWKKSSSDISLYQVLLKRAVAAQLQGEIKGIFFLQGESDSKGYDTDHVEDWHLYFEQFVNDIREDLKNETLPIVFGQIGKKNHPGWQQVKESQSKVALPYVDMIKTDDIDYETGNVHYNSAGYLKIGRRFGKKYVEKYMTND